MKRLLPPLLFLIPYITLAQPAPPTPPVGEVSFPNSGSAAAQSDFLHGLAQLHNFEYEDAAKHFRRAEELDANFAIAYSGEAMSKNHGVWHDQDRDAAPTAIEQPAS